MICILRIVGEDVILIKELYYVLMKAHVGNAKQCKTLIKHQCVKVNGLYVQEVKLLVCRDDMIEVHHKKIKWPFVYYMLHKPRGYLSASYDKHEHYVLELFDQDDCFCLGRLDKDTTGLLIVTNDSSLKSLLLPQNHVEKTYEVIVNHDLKHDLVNQFLEGIIIDKDVLCLPAKLEIIERRRCLVTLCEGKYHQVKKMFLSCGYVVEALKRVSFGNLSLDMSLKEGEYRELFFQEITQLLKRGN